MEKLLSTFKLFSLEHFVYIFLAIIAVSALFFAFYKMKDNLKKWIEIGIVAFGAVFFLLEYIGRFIYVKDFSFFDNLPINSFQIFLFVSIFILIKHKEVWMKFAYLIMLPVSALNVLFIPNFYTSLPTFSLAVIGFVMVNIAIMLYSLLLIFWNKVYFEKKDAITAFTNYVIMFAGAHIINIILRSAQIGNHANYFGTMGEDYNIVFGLLYKWIKIPLVCVLPYVAVLVGITFLMYLPFELIKNRKEKQNQYEELVALGNLKEQQRKRLEKRKRGSQILVRSEEKAKPSTPKNTAKSVNSGGFVSTTKQINVNNDKE